MSIFLFASASMQAETDEPGPFERFFHAMRHAFTEPHQPTRPHRSKQHAKTESPTPSPGETPGAGNPPNERNTRTTVRANSKKGDDLRYGIPVPGKQGFVTSPFSPDSGYIDVRGFQPGTPVKDPYSGKIILTP
jgi:hypothetical protein